MGISDRFNEYFTEYFSKYTGKIKQLAEPENFEFLKQLVKNMVSPDKLSPMWQLKLFSLTQVPLLFLVQPKVQKLDDESCEIRVNLNCISAPKRSGLTLLWVCRLFTSPRHLMTKLLYPFLKPFTPNLSSGPRATCCSFVPLARKSRRWSKKRWRPANA